MNACSGPNWSERQGESARLSPVRWIPPVAAPAAQAGSPETLHGDARIDDVIESLSQALGAAIHQQPESASESKDAKSEDPASMFERWTVRPRRTQQQN